MLVSLGGTVLLCLFGLIVVVMAVIGIFIHKFEIEIHGKVLILGLCMVALGSWMSYKTHHNIVYVDTSPEFQSYRSFFKG